MFFYRLLLSIALPFLWAGQARRIKLGRETQSDADERAAQRLPPLRSNQPLIWLHGASNGELTSARSLIEDLRVALPDHQFLVTANTVTARAMVEAWDVAEITAYLAPTDTRATLRRFLDHWRPVAQITIENELWPNRIHQCHARNIPVCFAAAKMSDRSAKRWRRFGKLASTILRRLSLVAPQTDAGAMHLISLGLAPDRLSQALDLKAATKAAQINVADLEDLRHFFRRETTVLAASTHEGEEEIVVEAFERARQTRPDLRLILAPRHPQRAAEIGRLLSGSNLDFAQRSAKDLPGDKPVYLADTMGEMPLMYSLASSGFVGGTLVDKGGHTPYEPALYGMAISHGGFTSNFDDIYKTLDGENGAHLVTSAAELADFWSVTPDRSMAARARKLCARDDTSGRRAFVARFVRLLNP